MNANPQSELEAFMDFCLEHWNDPSNDLEDNPELMAKLKNGIQTLLIPACEEGDENAMFWMAECYEAGWGVELDGKKAFALRRKLAEMGHLDQQINMGDYYRWGDVVKRNPRTAFCWYMRAAKQASWYGEVLVADCYFKGDGVKMDYKEAVRWYELAATHPDKRFMEWNHAALQLAYCYREGLGVKKDLAKAAEWYDKADCHKEAELIRLYGDAAEEHNLDIPF